MITANQQGKQGLKVKGLFIGLAIFLAMVFFMDFGGSPKIVYTAAVTVIMSIYWIFEIIPLGITALMPLVLLPLLGVLSGSSVSESYINYVIFLYLGGFMMAIALEKFDIHRRIALKLLSSLGTSKASILGGFMLTSAALSMFVSNTATAMMMIPIAMSVISTLNEQEGQNGSQRFGIALLIGIAYSCSIGGISTLVGTPPNMSLVRIVEILYPNAPQITFAKWFLFNFPLTAVILIICYGILYAFLSAEKTNAQSVLEKSFFLKQYQKLGSMTVDQKRVSVYFVLLVLLWIFKNDLVIDSLRIPGWSALLPANIGKYIDDGTTAIFISLLLFMTPSHANPREGLLTGSAIFKLPWDVVLLFGGGFALWLKPLSYRGSPLTLGSELALAQNTGNLGMLSIATTTVTFLTEFTSNTATAEMMLPIVSGLCNQIHLNPLFLMVPVTVAASLAFMFPVATPPNAIIFATGMVRIKDMVKLGFWLNILSVIAVIIMMYLWGTIVFEIDLSIFPDWAIQGAAAVAPPVPH